MGKDSRSRNLHHFLFPRRIMVLQTSFGFQSKMLSPSPYRRGKHTLNTFKHKTPCLGLAVRVTRQLLIFSLTDIRLFPATSCPFQHRFGLLGFGTGNQNELIMHLTAG